jgi:ribonuclease R
LAPRQRQHHPARAARLPETVTLIVSGTDHDGDPIARLAEPQDQSGPPPRIHLTPEPPGQPALAIGAKVLARLRPAGPNRYQARVIRRLDAAPARVLGVLRAHRDGPRLTPTDRREKAEWAIQPNATMGADVGELVLAEPIPHRGLGLRPARVVERLGPANAAGSVSLIAIHTHGIPDHFPADALAEAAGAHAVELNGREDIRALPLVTIDDEDARDFDDAVFAERRADGFRLVIAIADVAHYVRPGSPLDAEARRRGNSVYFPDRVVPMLPEHLSNDLCSLRPNEDRACLFVELTVDANGEKTAHRFGRGLMRSAARLTYAQVQQAHDANTNASLEPLYAAFQALLAARVRRGTLELDLPERKVTLNNHGRVVAITPRPRLDSHRLIEEFMILANVAAAEELDRRNLPTLFRVHPPPTPEKLAALRKILAPFGVSVPPGARIRPGDLDHALRRAADTEAASLVHEAVLRAQSNASYDPNNIGHFGLALARYTHFTSPIRRYADLLVHRALIGALGLGADAQAAGDNLEVIGAHVTATEKRATLAERDVLDRYLAAYMAEKIGARFTARISGVTRFGLFVTLTDSGASGLVPLASLPDDFWLHDEDTQTLTGRRSRQVFHLAQEVEVRLSEAMPLTGGLVFHVLQGPSGQPRGKRSRRL